MECLPFYYADSMGIFDSLGIDIHLVTFDAAMDADTAFKNQLIDGIVTDMVKACVWEGEGDSLQMVMTGDLNMWLITAPKARLLNVESVKEKIIGITRNSFADYFTDRILSSVNLQSIDLNKPQINNIRIRTLMVNQNQYDGALLPEPFANEAVARGAKRLTGSKDLHLNNMMCVLFGDSIYQTRKTEIDKIRKAYDKAVKALNIDTTSRVLEYFPQAYRIEIPDSLYMYLPLSPSITPHDSMMADVKQWAKGRGLIK